MLNNWLNYKSYHTFNYLNVAVPDYFQPIIRFNKTVFLKPAVTESGHNLFKFTSWSCSARPFLVGLPLFGVQVQLFYNFQLTSSSCFKLNFNIFSQIFLYIRTRFRHHIVSTYSHDHATVMKDVTLHTGGRWWQLVHFQLLVSVISCEWPRACVTSWSVIAQSVSELGCANTSSAVPRSLTSQCAPPPIRV